MKKPLVYQQPLKNGCRLTLGTVQILSLAAAIIVLGILGCEDERKAPVVPGVPVYSSTLTLLNNVFSNGDTLSATFTLRDTLTKARLFITGILEPDSGLVLMDALNEEVRILDSIIVRLSARILELELIPDSVRTPEQNSELDSLRTVKLNREEEKGKRLARIDSLDTRLDDRFKVGIALDNEIVFVYPRAIYLDSAAVPNHLSGGDRVLWGQGFFLGKPDPSGWRGKTMVLNMERFWVADETYHPLTKPPRPSDPDGLPELEPKEWISRLTPGSHTLKIFFGSVGTQTRLTVSLYVVYKSVG